MSEIFKIFGDRSPVEMNPYKVKFGDMGEGSKERVKKRIELHLSHYLTFGECTSMTAMDRNTINLCTKEGLPLFSPSQMHEDHGSRTFSNIDYLKRPPSVMVCKEMIDKMQEVNPSFRPDTFICSFNAETKSKLIQLAGETWDDGMQVLVLPHLATTVNGSYDPAKKGIWFIADLKQSTAHFKKVEGTKDGADYAEIESCVIDPWWICGSFYSEPTNTKTFQLSWKMKPWWKRFITRCIDDCIDTCSSFLKR